MTFGTVIEIIVAIFTVFGLYHTSKMIAFLLAYDKNIRGAVSIAVELDENDDEETKELKYMCARQASFDLFGHGEYIIIENDKE
ncbi:MAG: hypothetical protein IJ391_01290 [Clostridia bacterium]|nr:hypothetical protein [Clostridia bacterium]